MILTDGSIRHRILTQNLITGYEDLDKQLQPASFDVRLQDANFYIAVPYPSRPIDPEKDVGMLGGVYYGIHEGQIDEKGRKFWALKPNDFVIASTEEVVKVPDDLVCVVDGCSTLGRLGVLVHITAGFIDPGFEGRVTLEIKNVSPHTILLRPHMRIGQFVFYQCNEAAQNPYKGRYQGQTGPLLASPKK